MPFFSLSQRYRHFSSWNLNLFITFISSNVAVALSELTVISDKQTYVRTNRLPEIRYLKNLVLNKEEQGWGFDDMNRK